MRTKWGGGVQLRMWLAGARSTQGQGRDHKVEWDKKKFWELASLKDRTKSRSCAFVKNCPPLVDPLSNAFVPDKQSSGKKNPPGKHIFFGTWKERFFSGFFYSSSLLSFHQKQKLYSGKNRRSSSKSKAQTSMALCLLLSCLAS